MENLKKSNVIEYTSKWNKFQFRSPVYLDGHFDPNKIDLVKWTEANSKEYCFSVGWLDWDEKEKCFEFQSCGMRYFEEAIPGLNEWVLAFAKLKTIEFKHRDEEEYETI